MGLSVQFFDVWEGEGVVHERFCVPAPEQDIYDGRFTKFQGRVQGDGPIRPL
jgi:hypothetical protein